MGYIGIGHNEKKQLKEASNGLHKRRQINKSHYPNDESKGNG